MFEFLSWTFFFKKIITKKDPDLFWDLAQTSPTLEHHDMSNLFKILFADDESVVLSTNVYSANQNQTQSHDDLTNPHRRQAIDISEDDHVQIEDSEGVTKMRSK